MNPVFWLLVVLALGLVWFAFSGRFQDIGGAFQEKMDETKENIMDEGKDNEL